MDRTAAKFRVSNVYPQQVHFSLWMLCLRTWNPRCIKGDCWKMNEQAIGTLDEMPLSIGLLVHALCPLTWVIESAMHLLIWLFYQKIPGTWSFEPVPGESIKPGNTAFVASCQQTLINPPLYTRAWSVLNPITLALPCNSSCGGVMWMKENSKTFYIFKAFDGQKSERIPLFLEDYCSIWTWQHSENLSIRDRTGYWEVRPWGSWKRSYQQFNARW